MLCRRHPVLNVCWQIAWQRSAGTPECGCLVIEYPCVQCDVRVLVEQYAQWSSRAESSQIRRIAHGQLCVITEHGTGGGDDGAALCTQALYVLSCGGAGNPL